MPMRAAAWPMAKAVAASGCFFRPQSKLQEISTEKTLGACARFGCLERTLPWSKPGQPINHVLTMRRCLSVFCMIDWQIAASTEPSSCGVLQPPKRSSISVDTILVIFHLSIFLRFTLLLRSPLQTSHVRRKTRRIEYSHFDEAACEAGNAWIEPARRLWKGLTSLWVGRKMGKSIEKKRGTYGNP